MNIAKIKSKAAELAGEITELRHHLHANPELSWQEIETSRLIESKLKELGFENIKRGVDGTEVGVRADLIGDPAGPCVALRSDIDALPLLEENTCSYKSRTKAMHACGHDGHISALLGTAKLLASMKSELSGRVRFLFQPAEEHGLRSGAKALINEGALDGVQAIGGMHLWSFVPTGRVQWRNGPVMASADCWNVKFTGKGGHGAMPHDAIDPTVAAANFIGAAQTIVSRELNPVETAVVSLGRMTSGGAFNIIPPTAELEGSLRSFNPEIRAQMEGRLRRIADGIAAAYRCTAELKVTYYYPSVVNHAGLTAVLKDTAVQTVGENNVEESPLLMVSEDFSFYQEKIPGTFFFVGAGSAEKGTDFPHHSPRFNLDDDVLPIAMSLMSSFAFATLEKLKAGEIKAK